MNLFRFIIVNIVYPNQPQTVNFNMMNHMHMQQQQQPPHQHQAHQPQYYQVIFILFYFLSKHVKTVLQLRKHEINNIIVFTHFNVN